MSNKPNNKAIPRNRFYLDKCKLIHYPACTVGGVYLPHGVREVKDFKTEIQHDYNFVTLLLIKKYS